MQTAPSTTETLCSVCIATYRRPELLTRLIESLMRQNVNGNITLEIIVVDNDTEESAKPVIERFQDTIYPLLYTVEPRKNISHARNKGVAMASGDYILFIDDDEKASETWVQTMLNILHTYDADGVFGSILPDFHSEAPDWMRDTFLFQRRMVPTGGTVRHYTTGNCLIKADILRNEALYKKGHGPFDADYGITGGEDSHLFNYLHRQNYRFVSAPEAKVSEYIPPARTTVRWMIKRAYRTANLYARRQIRTADHPTFKRLQVLADSIGKMLLSASLAVIHLRDVKKRWHWFLKSAANWGKLLAVFNIRIEGY